MHNILHDVLKAKKPLKHVSRLDIEYEKPVHGFDDELEYQIHWGNIPNKSGNTIVKQNLNTNCI